MATYVNIVRRLARTGEPSLILESYLSLSIALGFQALWFKLTYTYAEAPELLRGLPGPWQRLLDAGLLLILARMVFGIVLVFWLYYLLVACIKSSTNYGSREHSESTPTLFLTYHD